MESFIECKKGNIKYLHDNNLLIYEGRGIGPQEKQSQRKYQDMANQSD